MADEPMPDTTIGNSSEPSGPTSVEHIKAVSRRWIEVFNGRDDQPEAEVRAPEYVAYAPKSLDPNRWAPRRGLGSLRDSSTGSRIFESPWRTRWEKAHQLKKLRERA